MPRAWQAPPGQPGRWTRPEPQGPTLMPEGPARLPRCGSPVPPAAVALPAVPEPRMAARQRAERSAGVALPSFRLADSAHSARPPGGSARCEPGRTEATRLPAILRGLAERSAVAVARLRAQVRPAAALLQPPGERQKPRYRQHSAPVRRIQVPWRGRRDRRWRNSGK